MYTIQYFIDKFSAIPEDQWCSYIQVNAIGQRCAYGHCAPEDQKASGDWINVTLFPEGKALCDLSVKMLGGSGAIAWINNGEDPRFQQPTEKERVLAALQWCKEQEAEKMIVSALVDPEDKDDEDEEDWEDDIEDNEEIEIEAKVLA